MKIRESREEDKSLWDSFIDNNEGHFDHYFSYRYLSENITQLLVESDQSELVCICRLFVKKRALYSKIEVGGIALRKNETSEIKYQIISGLIKYIENNYSKHCSSFTFDIREIDFTSKNPLLDSKFRLRKGLGPDLPCMHILPLKAPFEEYIWKGLWSHKFRQSLNKVAKNGVK